MEYHNAKKRLEAVHALFVGSTTSTEKLGSIRALIKGVHSGLDDKLKQCEEAFTRLEKMMNAEIIELSAEHLPESTDEEKKRKKALLFFIKSWKDLQSEVTRVQNELNAANNGQNTSQKRSLGNRIFSSMKGPFGIITIAAVGAALVLQATSVRLTIKNNGCGTMMPLASLPIPLPGLSLPKDPIPSNGSAVATLPALTVAIDGTKAGVIHFQALKLALSFEIPSDIRDVTLDGASLLKKKTEVHLSDRKEHELMFSCKS